MSHISSLRSQPKGGGGLEEMRFGSCREIVLQDAKFSSLRLVYLKADNAIS